MKKILIFLIVTGALTFINFNVFASSYDDPVSNQTITIDTPITMLNGLSLYQVFGQTDLVKDVTNYTSEWVDFGVNASIYNSQFVFTPTYQYARLVNVNPNIYYSGDTTFFYASYKTTDGQAGLVVGDDYNFTDFIGFHNGTGTFQQIYGRRTYATVQANQTYIGIRTQASSNFSEIKLASIYVVNLTYHGIDNLSDFQIKYFLELYEILSLGITPSTYYIQGQAFGYGTGYDDGYDAGYDDGYDNGYSDGQEDGYDTGYLDGNVAGLETGYLNGYHDGFDDGLVSEVDTQWLLGFVTGTVNVLGVSVIPGITLGVFVFIPLFLGFIGFIFRLGGRRG